MDIPAEGSKAQLTQLLLAELAPDRPTTVVDVGANPINETPYSELLRLGGCRVVGFEPQPQAFAALEAGKGPNETYFPFAVGDGQPHDLRLFRYSGLASLFDAYRPTQKAIGHPGWAKETGRLSLDTVALDATPDLPPFDLLKIDIQGGEALVFQGAETVLKGAVAVITELRFMRLYVGEPMLGGVDLELRRQGFYLHKLLPTKSWPLAHSQSDRLRVNRMKDQLLDGDAVYLKNIAEPELLSAEQLKHLAILAASVFDSHSLVLYCLDALAARGAAPDDLPRRYADLLPAELHRKSADQVKA